jgi:hypothetical protein
LRHAELEVGGGGEHVNATNRRARIGIAVRTADDERGVVLAGGAVGDGAGVLRDGGRRRAPGKSQLYLVAVVVVPKLTVCPR